MDYKLINYNGLDCVESIQIEDRYTFKISEYIKINKEIDDILSISVEKDLLSNKEIDVFEDINYENYEVSSKLYILNIKYDLMIEYSVKGENSKINVYNKIIYKTLFFTIYEDDYSDNIRVYTLDIMGLKNNKDEVYFNLYGCFIFEN